MKLLKPAWVSHDGLPIFSVDIHPDGSRFATGGQGQDCGRVVIWNMAPLLNKEAEDDNSIPKILSQMDNHLENLLYLPYKFERAGYNKPVTIVILNVRQIGENLASSEVIIKLKPFGTREGCVNCVRWSMSGKWLASAGDDKTVLVWASAGAENWRCVANLRAHSGDILDLAWAPHDAWLASCSVDNSIIVWNALNLPDIVAVLKGHTGLVKGVAWDPVGKFLASQSDDHTLRVWRTSDWREDANITEPFEECGGTTHVLRLSWSPDGLYLVSAHAMNGGGPTAQIVERDGWTTDKDFVGHRKAVTCVRFNSNILVKAMPHSNKTTQYCCCAIGSRDRSLSVWLTALKRPLVVIKELFTSSVLDLSWSAGGLQLMACSWDGTVVYIQFSETEMGKPLSSEDKRALHERMYGKSASLPGLASASLLETPELLHARQGLQSPAKLRPNSVPRPTPVARGPTDKQIETRTPDGKRRITPMFIPTATETGEILGTTQQPTFSSSSESRSRIRVEVVDPNSASPQNMSHKSQPPPLPPPEQPPPPPPPAEESQATTPLPLENNKANSEVEVSTDVKRGSAVNRSMKRGRPSQTTLSTPVSSTPRTVPASSTATTQPTLKKIHLENIEEPRLPSLSAEKLINVQVLGCPGRILEAQNSVMPSPHGALYRVRMFHNSDANQGWEALLGSRVVALAASVTASLVACEDASLHVFESAHGRRPFPPFVLSAPAARLAASRTHALVLTTRARVSVWDLTANQAIVVDQSLAPLLMPDARASVISCLLTEKGLPAVTLSTGKAFVYSIQMQTWLLLGDVSDPVQQGSVHQTLAAFESSRKGSAPPLCALQYACNSKTSNAPSLIGGETAPGCTLSFLERQIASCRALDSPRDYKMWLGTLVRFLVHNGLEKRLRLILDELLGPAHSYVTLSKSWKPNLMGYSKHELLRDALTIVASNLTLQRLYTEYSDQLGMIETVEKQRESQSKSPQQNTSCVELARQPTIMQNANDVNNRISTDASIHVEAQKHNGYLSNSTNVDGVEEIMIVDTSPKEDRIKDDLMTIEVSDAEIS